MSMPTTSARWPRVHGSRTGRTAIPAIVPTRRSISRATAGASSSSCARYRSEPILSRDAPARGLPLAALSGLPRLLRRPDDLPDRDLDALGGPNLADPVAHELAAAAGTHHHAALGPDTAARPSQRRHRRPLGTVVSRQPPRALLDASAAAACSVLLALCLIESVWLAAVALFLLGYTGVITSAGCQTSLQLRSSDELRGRVMSLFTLIHGGCFPIAAPMIGAAWTAGDPLL